MERNDENPFDPEDLAECGPIAAALGMSVEGVAAIWERYSEEHFAGWLHGLSDLTAEQFVRMVTA